MSQHVTPSQGSGTEPPDLDATPVAEALRALAAALRSYRLYEGSNPMLDRFVTALRQKVVALWEEFDAVRLDVEEDRMVWEGQDVFPTGETGTELAFLFYKDGIREITLLPGFEDETVDLLRVLAMAPSIQREEDDLVTLLWQEDLQSFRYRVVESNDEGALLHTVAEDAAPTRVDTAPVREEEPERPGLTPDDFQDTLYFLDDAELRQLREEIELESKRDLWRDVLNALLDRLQDGDEERQHRIVGILGELLPSSLASAQFERSAVLLEDLVGIAGQPGVLSPPALAEIRSLFDVLGQEQTVTQLADILEELPHRINEESVLRLLSYFPPSAIGALMRAVERVEQPAVKRAFEACIQRLAESNRDEVVALLASEEPAVITGALRWVGRLEIGSAVGEVTRFLRHPRAEVRLAAIASLVSIRAATAGSALLPLLEDANRDVRIAAVRALGDLHFVGARGPLENVLSSKRVKDADRVEKLAFFESYGRLAGAEGVPALDKVLNGKGFLGGRESPELRACAALGLAKIRHPSARESLEAAAKDSDPVVRTAVARALRGENA